MAEVKESVPKFNTTGECIITRTDNTQMRAFVNPAEVKRGEPVIEYYHPEEEEGAFVRMIPFDQIKDIAFYLVANKEHPDFQEEEAQH